MMMDYCVAILLWSFLCRVSGSTSTMTTDVTVTSTVTDDNTTASISQATSTVSHVSEETTTTSTTTSTTTTTMPTSTTTQTTTTTLLTTTALFSTPGTTTASATTASATITESSADSHTGFDLLTLQFYYGLGVGAGVCLIVGVFLFIIYRMCTHGAGHESRPEIVHRKEDPGNLYEVAVAPPGGVPDPTAYDMPDEEGTINTSVLSKRIPTTTKVVAYDEVTVDRGDNRTGEYEEIPRSYRHRRTCRPPLSQFETGERQATPERTRRSRPSRKKKRTSPSLSAEKLRHVDPPYVNDGVINRGYLTDTGSEAGYLPMNQFRVATVTETYVDMTRDYVRSRRQDTRKSKDSDDDDEKMVHDYINVRDMDTTPPSQRSSGEPLINRDSKDSNKKRKWGLKYFSDEANMRLKNKFPFFQRSSKAKVSMIDPAREREPSCLYDDAIGVGAIRASHLGVGGLETFGASESEETTSECSHTTDSLCNEMMAETLQSE